MTADQTLALLESLLTADDNLLLWRSREKSGVNLFFVWSTRLGGGLTKGKTTLGAALFAFKEANAEALKAQHQRLVEVQTGNQLGEGVHLNPSGKLRVTAASNPGSFPSA